MPFWLGTVNVDDKRVFPLCVVEARKRLPAVYV